MQSINSTFTSFGQQKLAAPNHQYAPLQPRQFRVLQLYRDVSTPENIIASYQVVSLDDNPRFKALSYCWGDPTPTHHITLSNSTLGITENLHQFLARSLEFDFTDTFLWIDAICIDQTNLSERGHQVKLMGEVYSKAEEVIIWLGESTDEGWMAFDLVDFVVEMFESTTVPFSVEGLDEQDWTRAHSPAWIDVGLLLQRPWFSRIWVLQEVLLSQATTVVCGKNHLGLERFVTFVKGVVDRSVASYVRRLDETKTVTAPGLPFLYNLPVEKEDLLKGKLFLENLLIYCSTALATDPRDKVFAILGICADSKDFVEEPDYSCNISELYSNITREILLKYKSIRLLHVAGVGWRQLITGLPSWTPDYSTSSNVWKFEGIFSTSIRKVGEIRYENCDTLCLKGLVLDNVIQLGSLYEEGFSVKDIIYWYNLLEEQFFQPGTNDREFFEVLNARDNRTEPHVLKERFQAFVRIVASSWKLNRALEVDLERDSAGRKAKKFADLLVLNCEGKRMFLTTQGRLGICPPLAQLGDILFVPFGSEMPFLIRPLPRRTADANQMYQLVGRCYVSGIMSGEALELGLEEQEIMLV